MLRINAIGANAIDYLLRGSGCDPFKDRHLDLDRGLDQGPAREGPDGADQYFARAIEAGEPAGVWLGHGMESIGLDQRAGEIALDDDVRAVFGQLRYPDSTERAPVYIGSKPRIYADAEERLDKLVQAEVGALLDAGQPVEIAPERYRQLEDQAAASGRKAVAYYDWTFSPVKSVSVYWAALQAAGLDGQAAAIRDAHDQAVKIAIAEAEKHIAYTRLGPHTAILDAAELGEYGRSVGITAIAFGHSTNREHEPQLHTHVAVLNRVGIVDEWGDVRIGALDGKGFRGLKEMFAATYGRALEQLVREATGAVFETREDGKAREIVGVDPTLMAESSTRRSQVLERVEGLMATYREKHGKEPDASARKALAQAATLQTRAAKDGLAGATAIRAWGESRREWCERVVDEVDAAAMTAAMRGHAGHGGHPGHDRSGGQRGQRGHDPVANREAWLASAVTAAVSEVQQRYATWSVGDLAAAIDRQLGDVDELGVSAEERPVVLLELAREAVAPGSGAQVVQLTGHEPVPVPESMKVDGRPAFRGRYDERYATADHLALEARVVARAQETTAPLLDAGDRDAVGAVEARLQAMGLSQDQCAAVVGVLTAGRGGHVLIGPAGAGKSRTVGALAHEWTAAGGGRVFGVATSQIATMNLAGDGLTAINTTRFLTEIVPGGGDGARLGPGDLVVIDEAGMASAIELDRITTAVRDAGGEVLYTGDHHQLGAVGAGGLFAHLAEQIDPAQRHDLDQVHRFANDWEAAASLRLREGDHDAVRQYTDRGRLVAGTLEEMQAAAAANYVADRVAGRSALLIVGTNDQASVLSRSVREQLIELGQVAPGRIATLAERIDVSVGDLVQARRNDYSIRVDPARGADGTVGEARPVTNRELYTVVGRGPDGSLLVRDERGATAHLPQSYLDDHLALGYATTVYGALGLTVEAGHAVIDRDAGREDGYVELTRGILANYGYLVTEREADEHHPERIDELIVERMCAVLDNVTTERSASTIRELGDLQVASLGAVAARIDLETARSARHQTQATLAAALDKRTLERLAGETGARGRLDQAVRGAQLAGHDPDRVLREAVEIGELATADSVGDVLRWRIGQAVSRGREPENVPAAGSWAAIVAAHRDDTARGAYLGELGDLGDARQITLARAVADAPPDWALEAYGPAPDRDAEPAARMAWEERVAPEAGYRDLAGIPAEQRSLGAPPSPERAMHHALWQAAAERRGPVADDQGRDWTRASDAELYSAREAWDRAQQNAPAWVADELADTHRLVREYEVDAALDRARAEHAAPDSREAHQRASSAELAERYAEHHRTRVAWLEGAHRERSDWWAAKTPERDAASAAAAELDRRGAPATRMPEPADAAPARTEPEGQTEARPAAEPHATVDTGRNGSDTSGRWAWDEFSDQLRAEHGDRLDPDQQLSPDDLAHARSAEVAQQREQDAAARAVRDARLEQTRTEAAQAERDQAAGPDRDADEARQARDRAAAAEQERDRRAGHARGRDDAALDTNLGVSLTEPVERARQSVDRVREIERHVGLDDDLSLPVHPALDRDMSRGVDRGLTSRHERERDEGMELGD